LERLRLIFRVTRFIGAENMRDVSERFGAACSFSFKKSILLKERPIALGVVFPVITREPASPVGRTPVGIKRAPGMKSERKRSQWRFPVGPEITSYNVAIMESIVATSTGFAAGVTGGVCAAGGVGAGDGVCARVVMISAPVIAIKEKRRMLVLITERSVFILKSPATVHLLIWQRLKHDSLSRGKDRFNAPLAGTSNQ
jgi:hypothetical protein